jgi:putative FmdB family regulatory protein
MPVYEFLCQGCNRVFNFLAREPDALKRRPSCPKCGGRRMEKLFSRFASVSKGASSPKEEAAEPSGESAEDLNPEQEAKMERVMADLAKDMDSADENDPRQMARIMRRLTEATGEPVDDATDEAIRRLEAGEDPEKVEEKLAGALPEDGPGGGPGGAPSYDDGLYDL